MLVTLSALIVATMPALFQSATPLTGRDSTRALRLAHRAQGDFETLRRRLLPYETLNGGGVCDAVVGRYCYLQRMASTAPDEAPQVIAARARLLGVLDSLGAMVPGDRWILGQKVRYLMEAGRPQAADSMALACAAGTVRATVSWCLALAGYTAQQLGNYPRADAAFTSALAEMPEPERCKWQDLALLLGGRAAGPYRRVDCQSRDSVTAAFWRLVQPLYLTSVNDLRTEFLARITRMYIEQDTRTPMSDWWGSDDREALLRYGVAQWYTRGDVPRGETRPAIAGFRRGPSFNFFPDAHVFASPQQLTVADWVLSDVLNKPAYAPMWAGSFQPITDHQVALFRRGDSAFIVAAFDVNDDAALGETRQAGAFAAVVDRGGVLTPFGKTIEKAGLGVVSTLVAPWRPLIISLEVLDPTSRAAGRTRFAPKLPLAGTRLSLSDLLLYAPQDSAPASLAEAVPRALHALRAPSNRQIGIFWETYGVRPQGETFDYSLLVTPADQGAIHRALIKLHVVQPDRSLSLQWREVPSTTGGIASRGVTVDLSRLRPGRYRVQLMLTSGTDLPIVAERIIENP